VTRKDKEHAVQDGAKLSDYTYTNSLEIWRQWNEMASWTLTSVTDSSKETVINPFSFYRSWMNAMESLQERMKTSPPPQFDVQAVWKQWLDTTMSIWQQAAHMGGDSLGLTADWIKVMKNMNEEYVKTLHLPTSSDIVSLGERVVNLEGKIDNIEDTLDHINTQFLLLLLTIVE
jgi:hypothetical protein